MTEDGAPLAGGGQRYPGQRPARDLHSSGQASLAGRPLSPRAFRPFGIEGIWLGQPVLQRGLVRREGVALWRRLPEHADLFDRATALPGVGLPGVPEDGETRASRVVVAVTPARERSLRVPAVGARAQALTELAEHPLPADPAPDAGCLLLVDEGPGETWLYLAGPADPAAALEEFVGRRGRTDFARARRRSRLGGIGSVGVFLALVLIVYAQASGLGAAGQVLGAVLLAASLTLLIRIRPR